MLASSSVKWIDKRETVMRNLMNVCWVSIVKKTPQQGSIESTLIGLEE